MTRQRHRYILATTILVASAPVYAQTVAPAAQSEPAAPAAQPAPTTPDDTTDAASADIVVTANRRAENLQKVGVAVTAISEAQLRTANIADTRDLVRLVPALAFVQGATTKIAFFSIRGIGSYVNSDAFDQSVGIAFDGVPLARPGGSIADLVDLDRVEVLEGPQGMLFGKNASAGLINIITKTPRLNVNEGQARVSYGSFNELQTSGTINLALGKDAALRASAWRFRHDGYVDAFNLDRKLGEKNSFGGRLRLRWQPSTDTDINLTGQWTGANQDPAVTTLRVFATDALGVQTLERANGIVPGPGNRRTSSTRDLYNTSGSGAYTAQIDQGIGSTTLTSVTSYRAIANNENYDPASTTSTTYIAVQGDKVHYRQFSQEVRLTSAADQRLRFVLGAIYFNLDLDDQFYTDITGLNPVPVSYRNKTILSAKHYAAFGELTFDVIDGLRAIAGGRISHDRMTGTFNRRYGNPPIAIIPTVNGPGASAGPISLASAVEATEPSYRFGVQYDVARDVMLYATASRGYKGPGIDYTQSVTQTTFNINQLRVAPEIAKNYEIGLRSQFFDRRLTLNLTAFAERFSNFQTTTRLPTAAILYATQNAKELRSEGIQGTLSARLPQGFSINGSAAYIHARYTDFENAPCYPREPTAPVGTPLTRGICVAGIQNLNGHPLANSPRFRGSVSTRWDGDIAGGYPVFGQVEVRHQSSEVFNTAADPFERQRGYEVVNLAAGIRTADDRLGLSLYAKNLTKATFVSRTVPQIQGAYYSQTMAYDSERTFGAALDVRF